MKSVSNGVRGDLFAIVWDPKSKRLRRYNGRVRPPLGLAKKTFANEGISGEIPLFGKYSLSTPGFVDGWYQLLGEFGNLPMERVLKPAIGHAFDGQPIPEIIAKSWKGEIEL